ncbi:hypothetical protein SeLEV6574_g01536 [Synchytrium endobioticum]|uniref:Uncharacterized protein n=1 Tax=Synchytrium endobioticum TaxID=286115 RepID=A0A507DD11_9FUNG|nr:hypothetical protein SeLEV6574_g01536 [Synchytrium endobioticum]
MDAAPTRRAGRPYDIIVWYAPERTSVHRCIGASRVQRLARRIENSRKLAYGPLHLQVFSLNGAYHGSSTTNTTGPKKLMPCVLWFDKGRNDILHQGHPN